jgi:PPM family protein phosphatase
MGISPTNLSFGSGKILLFTEKNEELKQSNQDSASVIDYGDDQKVLLVSDGAGGQPAGEKASSLAVQSITQCIQKSPKGLESLRAPILDGIEKANQTILNLGVGAACTLSVVELKGNTVRAYHMGDSSILVCGNKGKVKFHTTDHSPSGLALEAGVINEKEAMVHEERHLLTNMLGSAEMKIEIGSPLKMRVLDTLVVASDGLWDNLEVKEVVDIIRKGTLESGMARLVEECRQRMKHPEKYAYSKQDDLTVILHRPFSP